MNVRTNLLPIARKALLNTAVAGAALTVASLVKTPGKTLNPLPEPELTDAEYFDNSYFPRYNYAKSVLDNTLNQGLGLGRAAFDFVIDPICEKPLLPTTVAALSMLGACALPRPKEGEEENAAKSA